MNILINGRIYTPAAFSLKERTFTRKSSTMMELDVPQPRRVLEKIPTPAMERATLSF